MNDRIEVRGLRLEVIVGVLDHERTTAQPIEIDLDLLRDFADAASRDDLVATTNYAEVTTVAARIAREGRFSLLESLAVAVGEAVLDVDAAISAVTVGVRKLAPPVDEDVVSLGVRTTVTRA